MSNSRSDSPSGSTAPAPTQMYGTSDWQNLMPAFSCQPAAGRMMSACMAELDMRNSHVTMSSRSAHRCSLMTWGAGQRRSGFMPVYRSTFGFLPTGIQLFSKHSFAYSSTGRGSAGSWNRMSFTSFRKPSSWA